MRVALWPLDTLDELAEPALIEQGRALQQLRREQSLRAAALDQTLERLVPAAADREARAKLLAIRRRIRNTKVVGPVSLGLDPAVMADLAGYDAGLAVLQADSDRFATAHSEAIDRQRTRLRELTATPAFGRALAVANPEVFERWETARQRPLSGRARARRLETTVLHYLARAAGRPTPQGLWAGATVVQPGDSDDVDLAFERAEHRASVVVDIRPFALMASWLAAQTRYRERPVGLAPTFHRRGDRWVFARTWPPGWVDIASDPFVDKLVGSLGHRSVGPGPNVDWVLSAVLSHETGPEVEAQMRFLIETGALEPAPRLKGGCADAWETLADAGNRLLPADREAWCYRVGEMLEQCRRLSERLPGLPPVDVVRAHGEANHEVLALWTGFEVPNRPPAPVLMVDSGVPWRGSWSLSMRNRITGAVGAILAHHARDGTAEFYRRCTIEPLIRATDGGHAVPLASLAFIRDAAWSAASLTAGVSAEAKPGTRTAILSDRFGSSAQVLAFARARDRAWETTLRPSRSQRVHHLDHDGPPRGHGVYGTMTGQLVMDEDGRPGWWAPWGRPQPGLMATRLMATLTEPELVSDLRRIDARIHSMNLSLAEVIGRDPLNPGAAVRPALTETVLDAAEPIGELPVNVDPTSGRAIVNGWLVPVYNSTAAIGFRDPLSRLLFELAMAYGWEFVSFGFPLLDAELKSWHHLPRLLLADGTVLSPERWVLPGSLVADLTDLPDPARFAAWSEEIHERGIPNRILAVLDIIPGAAGLLMRVDSPLCVRCLFDRIRANPRDLLLVEAPDPARLPVRDGFGRGHLAELSVTWVDPTEFS